MLKCSFNVDSIGCGTEFMERLHKQLQYFIIKQQSQDPAWQKVEVILSGYLVSISLKSELLYFLEWNLPRIEAGSANFIKPEYDL